MDKFADGVATSIKSIDLNAATYQDASALASKIDGYVDKVADFPGATFDGASVPGSGIGRALDLRRFTAGSMTPAQQAVINASTSRAQNLGVTINLRPIP